jgi:hypothetical protein
MTAVTKDDLPPGMTGLTLNLCLIQVATAAARAAMDGVDKLAGQLGVTEFDGEPVTEFVARRAREHLETLLRNSEDADPGQAARMAAVLDKVFRA